MWKQSVERCGKMNLLHSSPSSKHVSFLIKLNRRTLCNNYSSIMTTNNKIKNTFYHSQQRLIHNSKPIRCSQMQETKEPKESSSETQQQEEQESNTDSKINEQLGQLVPKSEKLLIK